MFGKQLNSKLLGPLTGVTSKLWQSGLGFVCGVGAMVVRSAQVGPRTFEKLADLAIDAIIIT